MLGRVKFWESAQTFQPINRSSKIVKKVQSFGEFVLDVSIELVLHASLVSNYEEEVTDENGAVQPSTEEEDRLLALTKSEQHN